MKFFKNPVVALILALVLVLGSTIMNVHFKFGALCRNVSEELYAENGIAQQLQSIRSDAAVLATVAERNGITPAGLTRAADELQSVLSQGRLGAGGIYRYYDALLAEITSARQELLSAGLNDADAETVNGCFARIDKARDAISSSDYNELVRSFLDKYDHFPANFLGRFADIQWPETFT